MRSFFKSLKQIIIGLIGFLLVLVVLVACYFMYLDSNTSNAKAYLVKRYGINEKELKPKKYVRYVYEDIADCDNLWFKKCTSDKSLAYQYIFKYKDTEIIVSEDDKTNLTDNSELSPVEEENSSTEEEKTE